MRQINNVISLIVVLIFISFIGCDKSTKQIENKPPQQTNNSLKTINISNQEWSAENLSVDKYRNGDPIPQVQNDAEWQNLTTGAWCHINNDADNGKNGKLYNWYAVNDPRGLAPEGWKIPNENDWKTLEDELGGWENAGKKMKSKEGWPSNSIGTNESDLTFLPLGYRGGTGKFLSFAKDVFFWSATEDGSNSAYSHWLVSDDTASIRDSRTKVCGMLVRCLKINKKDDQILTSKDKSTEWLGTYIYEDESHIIKLIINPNDKAVFEGEDTFGSTHKFECAYNLKNNLIEIYFKKVIYDKISMKGLIKYPKSPLYILSYNNDVLYTQTQFDSDGLSRKSVYFKKQK